MEYEAMNPRAFAVAFILVVGIGVSLADDPPPAPAAPPIPRTHVDSTVVGDSAGNAEEPKDLRNAPTRLSNDHGFQAGAPDLVRATAPLRLTAQQTARIHDAIELADAGAAALIKRENVVCEMLAATTPDDPLYAKLKAEQASADSRWNDNRAGLRRAVSEVLTPAQRAKFELSISPAPTSP
jgi:Spy/CpxP family protein refolding chaperone